MISDNDTTYDFKVDDIFSYALAGVNRAAAFIGAVLNKNNCLDIKQWHMGDQFEITPKTENSIIVLNEFKDFVVKNALCEMIMAFEATLNELYDGLLIVTNTRSGQYNLSEHKKRMKNFMSANFEHKINAVDQILTNIKETDFWKNLKYVRNCIEHNYSKVNNGSIKLFIPMVEVKIIDEKTKKEYLFTPEKPFANIGEIAGHPAKVIIDIAKNKEKIFNNGDIISFTDAEINFLIAAMNDSINFLRVRVLEYLLEIGNKLNFKGNIIHNKEELHKTFKRRELHVVMWPKDGEEYEYGNRIEDKKD